MTQVKYEMLSQVRKDAMRISGVAANFGFSRAAFYKAQEDSLREGLAGLISKQRSPKGGHELTEAVLALLQSGSARASVVDRLGGRTAERP